MSGLLSKRPLIGVQGLSEAPPHAPRIPQIQALVLK